MILSCSSCDTNFRVQPELIGLGGRFVRCSKCNYEWLAKKDDDVEEEDMISNTHFHPTLDEIFEEVKPKATKQARGQNSKSLKNTKRYQNPIKKPSYLPKALFNAIIFTTLIFLTLLFGVIYKDRITSTFPPTQRLYNMIGLYDNSHLEFGAFTMIKIYTKESQELAISIPIKNSSNKSKFISNIKVTLLDKHMQKLKTFVIQKDQVIRPHNEILITDKRLTHLPIKATNILVEIGNFLDLYLNAPKAKTMVKIQPS